MGEMDSLGKREEGVDFCYGAYPQALDLEPTGRTRVVTSYEWEATYPDGGKELLWSQPDSLDARVHYEAIRRQAVKRISTWRDLLLTKEEWAHVAAYMRSAGDREGATALEEALASLPGGVGPLGVLSWTEAGTIWQICYHLGIPL